MKALAGKVAVVTGANTGIGKETAKGLAERGATVVLAVRDLAKGEAARADILDATGSADLVVLPLDLGSRRSIRTFVELLNEQLGRLDILVNNAGLWTRTRQTTEDGFEATFGVNHLGTFLLTTELLPLLEKSAPSRVVVVSSDLHYRGKIDWSDPMFERRAYGAVAAYSQSKLANVLFTKALARRVEGKGVFVNAVHPGVVATELTRELPSLLQKIWHLFLMTPEQGAATSIHVAMSPALRATTGAYFERSRVKVAAKAALDVKAQERLWELSERLLGLSPSANASARRDAAA
ncbi:MAG: SDR family oxidoreductase [Labilithrix sp.]|nr:SDR family oxidoreductase [Labilithrix sp.]